MMSNTVVTPNIIYRLYTICEFASHEHHWHPTPFFPVHDIETADRIAAIAAADHFDADPDTLAVRLVALDAVSHEELMCIEGVTVDFNIIP